MIVTEFDSDRSRDGESVLSGESDIVCESVSLWLGVAEYERVGSLDSENEIDRLFVADLLFCAEPDAVVVSDDVELNDIDCSCVGEARVSVSVGESVFVGASLVNVFESVKEIVSERVRVRLVVFVEVIVRVDDLTASEKDFEFDREWNRVGECFVTDSDHVREADELTELVRRCETEAVRVGDRVTEGEICMENVWVRVLLDR